MKTVFFTGGGSGGHVMPGLSLIKGLISTEQKSGKLKIYYIGGYNGVEREIIKTVPIPYKAISTGKLRRYFSFLNFTDLFRILMGLMQSFFFLLSKGEGEKIIFSTGGFVSVPVVVAGFLLGFKIFIHEQTSRVGLANKICSYFANKVFVSFEDSIKFFPKHKTELTGYPLRKECFEDTINTTIFNGIHFDKIDRQILFVTGGGNGSLLLNNLIRDGLDEISKHYFIIHQVGIKFVKEFEKLKSENYHPVALIGDEMIDLFKVASIVISRAGAGTVCELRALNKSSILIPLKIAQNNEQYFNALENKKHLNSLVVEEDELENLNITELLERFVLLGKNHIEKSSDICLNGTKILIDEILK